MTAPRPHEVTLDRELVLRFAAYLTRLDPGDGAEPIRDWGCFYSSLVLATWAPAAPWGVDGVGFNAEERALATVFDQLTPSQRRRLRNRAEAVTGAELAAARVGSAA